MKNIKIIYLLFLTLFCLGLPAKSQEKEQLAVSLTDPNKPGKLEVNLINGSINVIGYAGKEVLIEAVSNNKKNQPTNSNTNGKNMGMRRIETNAGFELTAKESNNTIKVGVNNVNMTVNLSIKVPFKFSLKLGTINNGNIRAENITGNLEISNIQGSIFLKNISGSVIANTINEDINVGFNTLTPNTPMAFTTLNGNVDVTFPAATKANIKLKSDMGEVYSEFDVVVDKNANKPKQIVDKEKGMYKIKKDDWTYGKINGGGAEIMMKTMNGNLYIWKKK
jgi:hypothetical protein